MRVDLVERRGEFAVRGGILDVFPPTEEHPVRIDFFGDTVEEIRYFTVADQRSSDLTLREVTASPCRELLLTDEVRARAAALSQEHPELSDMLERIAQGHAVDGMEALSPVLVDGMELLVELLPPETHVLVCDPELVRSRAVDLVKTSDEFLHASWAAAAGGGKAPVDLGASSYRPLADVRSVAMARGLAWWTLSPFSSGPGADDGPAGLVRTDDGEVVDLRTSVSAAGVESRTIAGHLAESHRGDTEAAIADIARRAREGWRVVLVAEGKGTSKRYAEVAAERELAVRERDDLTETPAEGMVTIVTGELRTGFVADSLKLALFTTSDLSGQRPPDKSARKMPGRRKNQINPLELTPGDPVVHAQHGVGRYVEMVQRTVQEATREYLLHRVRALQAGPAGRPAVRAHGPAGPGHPLRRRGEPDAGQDGRRRLGQAQGPGPQGRPRDRRRADQALRRAGRPPAGTPSPRTRPGSASWRTPSTSWRRPTSWPPSTRSSGTWSRSSRWTG